jgi:hypothetical protein
MAVQERRTFFPAAAFLIAPAAAPVPVAFLLVALTMPFLIRLVVMPAQQTTSNTKLSKVG